MKRLIALVLAFLIVLLALFTPIVGPSWIASTASQGMIEKGDYPKEQLGLLYAVTYLMVTLFQAVIVIAILSTILIRGLLP